MEKQNYCIILAGGIGRRLWPCSRKRLPKQFIDFFGVGRTLLQQTYDRFARFVPAGNIFVSTFVDYEALVREQLPELPAGHVLCEPVQLSTAPAVSWASQHIALHDPQANVVVAPSDQYIVNEERFVGQLRKGLEFVGGHKSFLAIGVRPTVPNTAYGYIQLGERLSDLGLCRIKSFTEKPAADYAQMFVESGEFLWNTGLFLWNVATMDEQLRVLAPQVYAHIADRGGALSDVEEIDIVKAYYPANMHRSIDLVVLDACPNTYVQECDFGWADVGSWPEMYKVADKDGDGNAVSGSPRVVFSDCRDTFVRLPEGMGAVVKGLEGYLVAQSGNMLVVCPNDDPALARQLANGVQMELGEDFV